jgi:predicted HAD superfamily Cof-like phosphohydrolase
MEATRLHNLILEELMELNDAIDEGDIVEIADAIADIIYVTAQQAVTLGFPVDALLREVQRSNMSKLGADGLPIFRDDGKVLKGPNFSHPYIAKVLTEAGYD